MTSRKITLNEASERSGLSTKTLRRWIASGRLRAYRVGTRAIRVDPADVDDLFREI